MKKRSFVIVFLLAVPAAILADANLLPRVAGGAAGLLASGSGRINHLLGDDPAKWRTEFPLGEPAPSARAGPVSGSVLGALPPYSIYIGGTRDITPVRVAADQQGNVFVAGNLSWRAALDGALRSDIFVMKLDPNGGTILTTFLGGDDDEWVWDMAIDQEGNVYLAGQTTSPNFPVVNAHQKGLSGASDGFVCKLGPTGGLVFSTYFGGSGDDTATAIAAGIAGNSYVTGSSDSPDFPVTPGAFQTTFPPNSDSLGRPSAAFVARFSPDGKRLAYSTFLGGKSTYCSGGSSCIGSAPHTTGFALAADAAGNAYVAGGTNTYDFPVTPGAYQTEATSSSFLSKLDPNGKSLVYSTYFGAPTVGADSLPGISVSRLIVDSLGQAYLTGSTASPYFLTTPGAYRPAPDPFGAGQPRAFVTKLNSFGTGLVYSTLVSGQGWEIGSGIAVDREGNAFVTGSTEAAQFPLTGGAFSRGGGFLVKLNPNGSTLRFSTLLPNGFAGGDVALDASGNVYLLGLSGYLSRIQGATPRLPPIVGVANAVWGLTSGRIAPGQLISIFVSGLGPDEPATLQLDENGRVSTSLAGLEVRVGGMPAPLIAVRKDQIDVVVPYGLGWQLSDEAEIEVLRGGIPAGTIRLWRNRAAPGVFLAQETPDGFPKNLASALNEDGTVNSPSNPARFGSLVSIFATGLGPVDPPLEDGEIAAGELRRAVLPVSVGFPDTPFETLFAGQSPDMVAGVSQINFRLPTRDYGRWIELVLTVGGSSSNSFTIFTAP